MKYILKRDVTFPAGTELKIDDTLGEGGLRGFRDSDDGLATLFMGRASALALDMVYAQPDLFDVNAEPERLSAWQRVKQALRLEYGMPPMFGPDPDQPEFPLAMTGEYDLTPPKLHISVDPGYDMGTALHLTHVLPQAQLNKLAATGQIMSVMTFDEHMHPAYHWIEPAEYGEAFNELTRKETPMTEAAYTELKPAYPGYVNLQLATSPTSADPLGQREGEADTVILTMRGTSIEGRNADDAPTLTAGPAAVLTMPIEAWDALMTDFNRMRSGSAQPVNLGAQPGTMLADTDAPEFNGHNTDAPE
jgi:hypothetical protein